jgi:hypothetical protein
LSQKLEAVLNKTLKYIFVVLVIIVVALGSFAGGFVSGHLLPIAGFPALQSPAAPSTQIYKPPSRLSGKHGRLSIRIMWNNPLMI